MRVLWLLVVLAPLSGAVSVSQRRKVVQSFNVRRNTSSSTTPLQVGNGNFAFGADVTGLQTFQPYAILSTWGWHNFSLPTTVNQTSVEDFTGLEWWTHGRLVTYAQPNPAENDISTWLIQNPQRTNLANVGFTFGTSNVTESNLEQKTQLLDMWSGKLSSSFVYNGSAVAVETWADPESDTAAIIIESELLTTGLGLFLDFPYPDRNKFDAPFVGVWNATSSHSTVLRDASSHSATIQHTMDQNTYFTNVAWEGRAAIAGPADGTHRYFITAETNRLQLTLSFSPEPQTKTGTPQGIASASRDWWLSFWSSGAFIDLSAANSTDATELQRRIITSQYLLAVNSASSNPPQESGLVNNGWYGKFHLEMNLWHTLPFARWGQFPLLWRSLPDLYERFLATSLERAGTQGYAGARWGKMTDPTGRSAPGEINSLLIWQQPHPMYFAETEYRSFPNATTLQRWDGVLAATADFMASFAFLNASTGVYDLGPPMYPVAENTPPNATVNPTFELAYWRFGLDVAARWRARQGRPVPPAWTAVRDGLAPLPVVDGTYAVYEGIPHMWTDRATTSDHPAMAGIFGLLPPPASGPPLDPAVLRATAAKIKAVWPLDESYGWDFALLAMNSLRLGNVAQAADYLLHPVFQFDDAGYPVGGARVPTPYFPNSASLLLAAAMMAGGWDGDEGPHFPAGWAVDVDGFVPAM
ncbi:Six-hairpin glycosidase-like protein [Lasiosphaeria miniovina]|uniref:Six-hairpin glycosidase-like protein n=1 Tax=Lasiosphaeria miniovina TaxID=1954250 RepID=A0AA39ZZN2_9PEZI|nr:Six-hairpin glycosidase-like protein [Lasiosphaeria miniovina]KAK0706544.1 Six-hairpin glycosidase-like protein [Lasiosphaeria miniovina]